MAAEVERKFLVIGDAWKPKATGCKSIRQTYIASTDKAAIRVRIVDDAQAYITIKSAEAGTSRSEFEYAVPIEDAREIVKLRSGRIIEKRRYTVPMGELTWEIDVFGGDLDGLVIAEIELPRRDAPFERPDWLGKDVTDDERYYNANLAENDAPPPRMPRDPSS